MKTILLLFLIISNLAYAQIREITKLSALTQPINSHASSILQATNGDLVIHWADSTKLFISKSLDNGLTWLPNELLFEDPVASHLIADLNSLTMSNGRILVTFKTINHFLMYSDDNGISWSEPILLPTINGPIRKRYMNNSSLTQLSNSLISLTYSSDHISNNSFIFRIKSNDGINWEEKVDTLHSGEGIMSYGSIISISDQNLILFYIGEKNIDKNDYTKIIYKKSSNDGGITWNEPTEVIHSVGEIDRPRVIKDGAGVIWLFYQKEQPTIFQEFTQSDILYTKSTDNGATWIESKTLTFYKGFDGWHDLSLLNGKPILSFSTTRETELLSEKRKFNIFFGIAEESKDNITPPAIYKKEFVYINNYPLIDMKVRTYVSDDNEIESVIFNYQLEGNMIQLQLYDDGHNNDYDANDGIYGNIISRLSFNYSLQYYYEIKDNFGNTSKTVQSNVSAPFNDGSSIYVMDVNNIWLPINNSGILADVKATDSTGVSQSGGRFEESGFIFSGGFALSGFTNGQLWANGEMSASRIIDYYPGKVNSEPGDILNKVYFLKASNPPFSKTWQMWKDAVKLGAEFYDGDGDAIYNPVDKNENGRWDLNEDRPDLIGDQTAWCVYNDAVPASDRNFSNVHPQGIEIKQTVFAYSPKTYPELSNVIFIRYNIENIGTVADKFDSVYFGAWLDPDLGNYNDDLIGCDTSLNSGYCYNDGPDDHNNSINGYGVNPPAFFTTLIQGPQAFIPGKTFIDNNGNGTFDFNIDTPLDSAKILSSQLLGISYIPGAKNQNVNSHIHDMSGHPTQGDPDHETQLRCYMEGKNQACGLIDPCNWEFGKVFGINCENVNPKFMYSGDPVTQSGWINTLDIDQRQMLSTGPFVLEKGIPQEIIIAYVVGRGTDALNSVTVSRDIVKDVIGFYNTNFSYIPVAVKETNTEEVPANFVLEQNYPNPFNPSTTIKYSIPVGNGYAHSLQNVRLIVYDILGREIATLLDEQQKPGIYTIKWNAVSNPSGIYFYRLTAGSFSMTKKMILQK